MLTLRELDRNNEYQTDKLGRCTINKHDYCDSYERHFGPFRDKPIIFWEIGVGRGDNLRMWDDYFVGADTIVGIDRLPVPFPVAPRPRILIAKGDVNDETFLKDLAKTYPPDIVLDDGSHKASDLHAAFDVLWPLVRILYAVEDLGTQYESKHGATYLDMESFAARLRRYSDEIARDQVSDGPRRICWEPGIAFLYK